MTNSSAREMKLPSQSPNPYQSLTTLLKQMRLSPLLLHWEEIETQALREKWSYARFLLALCELEHQRRCDARQQRLLREAQLPASKSFSNFDFDHCPKLDAAPLLRLSEDPSWLERGDNCLIFGASGVGKTHLAVALARAMVEFDKRVRFCYAPALVQLLQQEKQEWRLHQQLQKLDRFDLLVLDDLGYVKKTEAETSVLFELIAHRYERRSLLLTANQPFSRWDSIFSDSMMTVAAVDRLIHHAVIVEVDAESFRKQAAARRNSAARSATTDP